MTPRQLRRSLVALTGASLCLILLPVAAVAHAELDTISPADKSSGPAPQQIVGTFVQNLDPAKSNFKIVSASGTVVAEGGDVDSTNPRRMTLSLSPLIPGAYTIRWTTVSTEDGELDRGETTFTVMGTSPPPPSATPAPSAAVPPSAAPSTALSTPPSVSPSPSGGTGTPTSTTDALIPIIAVLVILAILGLWLLRGRGGRAA